MAKMIILAGFDSAENGKGDLASLEASLNNRFRFRYVQTVPEVLALVTQEPVVLVLMDLDKSDENGFNLLNAIRSGDSRTEPLVVFISNNGTAEAEEQALEAGVVDYIKKPCSSGVLRLRIENALSKAACNELDMAYDESIEMLAIAGRFKDIDTHAHVNRIADYAFALATEHGLDPTTCKLLKKAAPLHDVGKVGIPDKILQSTGRLNLGQMEIIKTHSEIGFNILNQSHSEVFRLAADLAHYHHERWDGSGYPCGLVGEQIPLAARIVAVVDVFDAITSERSYKKAWPLDEAFDYIAQNQGPAFDPEVVASFVRCRARLEAIFHTNADSSV